MTNPASLVALGVWVVRLTGLENNFFAVICPRVVRENAYL
jgi:hypothetical protein